MAEVMFSKDMRDPNGSNCTHCKEPLPTYSRICPNCVDATAPTNLLADMKELVDEFKQESVANNEVKMSEAAQSFWTLRYVISDTFRRDDRILDALEMLESLLYDAIDEYKVLRRKRAKRYTITVLIVVVLLASLATMV